MIDPAELSRMKADIGELLPDTCDILSVTRVPDGYGGMVESWATSEAGVNCRMDQKNSRVATAQNTVLLYVTYTLSIPVDTTITTTNRVTYGGETYRVTAINGGSWLAVKRLTLEVIH